MALGDHPGYRGRMDESSGPITGIEIAMIAGAFVIVVGFVVGLLYSFKRTGQKMQTWVTELTPSQILVDGFVASGGAVELRTRAVASGEHKVWLECNVPSGSGRWKATANVAHRISTTGAGYRDAVPEASATKEPTLTFGEDGDGVTASGGARRTGALTIPRGERSLWLQLLALPACPDGAEIFVSVAIADLDLPDVKFRAFVGVSAR